MTSRAEPAIHTIIVAEPSCGATGSLGARNSVASIKAVTSKAMQDASVLSKAVEPARFGLMAMARDQRVIGKAIAISQRVPPVRIRHEAARPPDRVQRSDPLPAAR